MRHEAFPRAFSYLWTLIRGRAAPPSSAKPVDVTRERDPQPPRLMPF
jgi:hypothetical protein